MSLPSQAVEEPAEPAGAERPADPRRLRRERDPDDAAEEHDAGGDDGVAPPALAPELRAQPVERLRLRPHDKLVVVGPADRAPSDHRQHLEGFGHVRPVLAQGPDDRARARALAHPVAQDRQRRLPQVELGVELAAESLDVEQRLLQQDQLRLHLHLVAPRDLEQVQQHDAEGNLLERLVEDGLADGAYRGLELVDAGAGGYPAALEVQHGDAPVVALEEGEEIAGEVELVARVERADDAEVYGRVAWALRVAGVDEDVPGVHVGVEEVVPEHLREEDLNAVLGELLDVGSEIAQAG